MAMARRYDRVFESAIRVRNLSLMIAVKLFKLRIYHWLTSYIGF